MLDTWLYLSDGQALWPVALAGFSRCISPLAGFVAHVEEVARSLESVSGSFKCKGVDN